MPLLIALMTLASALPAKAAPEQKQIVSTVLAVDNITDLAQRLGVSPEDPSFGSDIPVKILAAVAQHPADEGAWRAVYRYRSMTDAGYSLMFKWACFDALLENPTLFCDRYVRGDEKAAKLMRCAMWSDGSSRRGSLFSAPRMIWLRLKGR